MMVRTKQLFLTGRVRNMLVLLLVGAATVSSAFGQFEYVYGGDCKEVGNDVKPIVAENPCQGGGYIAVGTTNSVTNDDSHACLSHTDVYVVRTDNNGARLWELRYDINGAGSNDEGNAILECRDGSGFVIAGTTTFNLTTSSTITKAFLMKIDCDGVTQWTKSYSLSNTTVKRDSAYDVIEATTGNGGTAAVGDLMVCGTTQQTNALDGFLFRTTSGGALRWSSTIILNNSSESLFSLAEAPTAGSSIDVVAAGRYIDPNGSQGYVVRVKAFSGLITGVPQGVAIFGGANDESFNSVKVLTTSPETDNMVFAGWSNTPTGGGTRDIYLVKTPPNPCGAPIVQTTIDNSPNPGATLKEEATDVVEVLVNTPKFTTVTGFAVGDLAITGKADLIVNAGKSAEMFILPVSVTNLRTFAASGGRTFGDGNAGATLPEGGAALEEVGDNFIICGFSQGNLEGDLFPDPEDLYLVETDGDGLTSCENPWIVVDAPQTYTSTCQTVSIEDANDAADLETADTSIESDHDVCSRPDPNHPCSHCKRSMQQGSGNSNGIEESIAVQATPNPLPNGSALRLDLSGIDGGDLEIIVTDISGRVVYHQTGPTPWRTGTIIVPTDSWARGSYQVSVRNGNDRGTTIRAVVP
jgi:hypothetical protein